MKKINVLIVDDSLFFRESLKRFLSVDTNISFLLADDCFKAKDIIDTNTVDILVIDIYMDNLDGITFIKNLFVTHFIETIVVSGDESRLEDAKKLGVRSFIAKPAFSDIQSTNIFFSKIYQSIKSIVFKEPLDKLYDFDSICLIGASTGGPEAVEILIKDIPYNFCPTVCCIHMPDGFTTTYASRLNSNSIVTVKEAKNGDMLLPGIVYICKGGNHTTITQSNKALYLNVFNDPKITPVPSIDQLFGSAVELQNVDICAVVLTGMGSDGAKSIKQLHDKGFYTIGQDSATSVVYGIPKSSLEIGGLSITLPLNEIMKNIIKNKYK